MRRALAHVTRHASAREKKALCQDCLLVNDCADNRLGGLRAIMHCTGEIVWFTRSTIVVDVSGVVVWAD